tara:strand:- start:715 stop:1077 length:363 start_codon:yes stop_codon:yes gene_type:complete
MNNKNYISYEIKEDKKENTLTVNVDVQGELAAKNQQQNVPWQKVTTRSVRQLLTDSGHKVGPAVVEPGNLTNAEGAVSGTWVFETLRRPTPAPTPESAPSKPVKKRTTRAKRTKTTKSRG